MCARERERERAKERENNRLDKMNYSEKRTILFREEEEEEGNWLP